MPSPPSAHPTGSPPAVSTAGPTIADVVSDVLHALDTDGNGTISAAELAAFQARTGVDATTFKADVAKVDTSGDGAISTTELTAYLTKADTSGDGHLSMAEIQALNLAPLLAHGGHGDPTGGLGPTIAEVVTDIFRMLDANIDAVISASELTAFQTRTGVDATALKAEVAKIDTSGDGAISKAELTAFLTKADANSDGHISLTEAQTLVPLVGLHHDGGFGHG